MAKIEIILAAVRWMGSGASVGPPSWGCLEEGEGGGGGGGGSASGAGERPGPGVPDVSVERNCRDSESGE